MSCHLCRGKTYDSVTNYVSSYGDSTIVIKNTPCSECKQCGECYYTLEIAEKIEMIIDKLEAFSPEIGVYEYDKVVALCEEKPALKQNIV